MWVHFLIVLLVSTISTKATNDLEINFRSGVRDYFKYGSFTPEFQKFISTVNLAHAFRNDAETYIDDSTICAACNAILDEVLDVIRSNFVSQQEIQDLLVELCTSLIYESLEVCEGTISSNIGLIWYIIEARPNKTSDTVCGIIGQSYGCTGTPEAWSIDIAEGSSEVNKGVVSDTQPIKVLQLTDAHYDSKYASGSLGNCADPVCCTAGTVAESAEDTAGHWGDYRDCDTPLHAIEDALEHIATEHTDINYIYYTGDVISHRVWDTSYNGNTEDVTLIFQMLAEIFPNIPVYPVLGNHEPHPLNVFAPLEIEDESLSTQWLYDLAAEIWGQWLDEAAQETIRRGGYYTVLVSPGFRVIAINSNVAYTLNWWLLYDDVDPYGQLQWLADTLYEAEQNGEKVHILSHVPSSDNTCYAVWSHEYRRIIDRFAGTISAEFNGHTHRDELILFHSIDDPTEPINIAWNGGSLTTYSNSNPNYKLFEVDSESYEVLDFDVWTYNITAVNLTPDVSPAWYKLYTFKEAYGLDGAAPSDIRELAIRMIEDESVAEQYFRFISREADPALAGGCSSSCLENLVCKMLKSEYGDESQCYELIPNWSS